MGQSHYSHQEFNFEEELLNRYIYHCTIRSFAILLLILSFLGNASTSNASNILASLCRLSHSPSKFNRRWLDRVTFSAPSNSLVLVVLIILLVKLVRSLKSHDITWDGRCTLKSHVTTLCSFHYVEAAAPALSSTVKSNHARTYVRCRGQPSGHWHATKIV
jgi:hypothetical protein